MAIGDEAIMAAKNATSILVTTSRLLSTGVDAQTCRLIVLDREVGSMTEFKQIIGRGTRVHEDTRKFYFTVIDFRGATSHFADKDFDGAPVQIYEPSGGDPMVPPEGVPPSSDEDDPMRPLASIFSPRVLHHIGNSSRSCTVLSVWYPTNHRPE
jgi:hypothetical protein